MVDTTIAPAAKIEPPFADPVPDKANADAHSQPWNDFLTKQADRVADTYQRMGAAEDKIAHIKDGVTDGSNAPAGQIGEFLSAPGFIGALTSGAPADVITLTLTAGDWDVAGSAAIGASAPNLTYARSWLSTAATTETDPGSSGMSIGTGTMWAVWQTVGPVRFSVTAPATAAVHLGVRVNYTGTPTVSVNVFIRARRVR